MITSVSLNSWGCLLSSRRWHDASSLCSWWRWEQTPTHRPRFGTSCILLLDVLLSTESWQFIYVLPSFSCSLKFHYYCLSPSVTSTHPDADLNRLSLFEAQVQFRCCALSGFQFCELTFLFHPPLDTEIENIVVTTGSSNTLKWCLGCCSSRNKTLKWLFINGSTFL